MAKGADILNLATQHVTQPPEVYVLGAKAPKNAARWRGPWDCAEWVSWLVFQKAGILYGCDNNHGDPAKADAGTVYWARDAKALGRVVTVDQAAAIPGAAVLRLATAGQYGHIVVSDGQGGTVEAADSRRGLIASTLHGRRWTIGIMVPGIDYDFPDTPHLVQPPHGTIYRLTTPMMRGEAVCKLQCRLNHLGYLASDQTDWVYGPTTGAAVRDFQAAHGLIPDGEAGPLTLTALGVQV